MMCGKDVEENGVTWFKSLSRHLHGGTAEKNI